MLGQGSSRAVKKSWGISGVASYLQKEEGPGVGRVLQVAKKKVNCVVMILSFEMSDI